MNDHYMDVIQKYEGELVEIRRGRGAWICTYSDCIRLLKEYRGSLMRLEFEEAVLNQIRKTGIGMVDCCVRNQENELLSSADDGSKYILKEWYPDRECSLSDVREVLLAVGGIARLHRALQNVEWNPAWNLASMLPASASTEMLRHNQEMKRVRSYIRKKRRKNEFEFMIMANFEKYYDQACQAQFELEKIEQEDTEKNLCHGDLDHHHILIRGNDVGFIEFSQMHRGEQMADLYHFMRKAMEKHNWNETLGISMLERYDEEASLSDLDRKKLYYLFLYPEKYWKQLNYYNNGNKAWLPERNVEKLLGLEEQENNRKRFLEKMRLQMN